MSECKWNNHVIVQIAEEHVSYNMKAIIIGGVGTLPKNTIDENVLIGYSKRDHNCLDISKATRLEATDSRIFTQSFVNIATRYAL